MRILLVGPRPACGRKIALRPPRHMGFGARVATDKCETNGGIITNSAGLKTAKDTRGQPAGCCDYSGTVDGKPLGLTLLAAPANLRPGWWHNRGYGGFVAKLLGRAAMGQGDKIVVAVKRGENFHVRFGTVIHTSDHYDAAAACRRLFTSAAPADPASARDELLQPYSRK